MPRRLAMDGWVEIGGDVDWETYGGKWARQIPDTNQFLIIEHANMEDGGWKPGDHDDHYVCELSWLDLDGVSGVAMCKALSSYGWYMELDVESDKGPLHIVGDSGDVISSMADSNFSYVLAEVCYSYGLRGPLRTFGGSYPMRLRAAARREAEMYLANPNILGASLNRPCNRIGSTVREMASGDIFSAMAEGRTDVANLCARIYAKCESTLDGSPIPDAVKMAGQSSQQ